MQKKIWYYEKWVGRHASFPPRQSVKCCINFQNWEGVAQKLRLPRPF
jgi:hypothetical protein